MNIPASLLLDSAIALMAAVLAAMFWLRMSKQFKLHFVVLSLLVSFLAAAYVAELISTDIASKLLWNKFEAIGILGVPLLYLVIMVRYAGREDLLTTKNILLVSLVPIICLIMLWTNEFHHLSFQSTFIEPGSYQPFASIDGPFIQLQTIYSFGLEFAGIAIAAVAFIKSPKVQRAQVGLILLSVVVPTSLIGLSMALVIPFPIVDTIISGFFLSVIALYLAVYRYGLFYATPLVLNSIADIMQDSAVMLNQEGQVTYLNLAAERLIHRQKGYPLGRPIADILPAVHAVIGPDADGSEIVEMVAPDGRPLRLEVRYSSVLVERKKVGQLLIIRDITTQRRTEEALASSNSKLKVLYGVTRHDILNRITVIRGYGQLLKEKTEESSQASEYLKKMMDSTVAIEQLVNFTREYEKVGVVSPEWQYVSRVYQKAKVLCAEQGIEYVVDTGPLEVYADLMLERLFYILLDNTNRHGSKVTRVRLTANRSAEDYVIVYEDDGRGIPADDKGRIFVKGFGKDSGLGLYLGMQILSITNIGIKENGEPSKGSRFEMRVPKGKWRIS